MRKCATKVGSYYHTSVISGSGNIGGSSHYNPGQNIDDWSQHMLPDNYGTVI